MAKISFVSADTAPLTASPEGSAGCVETRAVLAGERDPIHLHQYRLAGRATVRIAGGTGGMAIYVWKGSAEAGGIALPPGSSAIAESGAMLDLVAGAEGATMLAFGLKDVTTEGHAGGHVHLLPKERVPGISSEVAGKRIDMSLHADSRCPTCSLWLHETSYFDADVATVPHSHSEDEVIFVIGGSLRAGARVFGPGTAMAVAAHATYGFHSGPDGLSFINFRGTSPTYRSADGTVVFDEAESWYARVKGGRPDYLVLAPIGPSPLATGRRERPAVNK
jgi:hypothetical protein